MKQVDSDALGVVNRALGLSGRGDDKTELEDGILSQGVDVAPMIRRGRTLQPSEGIFYGILRNIHSGSGLLTSQIFPWAADDNAVAPYPRRVPVQFDLWLLYATAIRSSGAGTVSASLSMRMSGLSQGWGANNLGAIVESLENTPLLHWTFNVALDDTFATLSSTTQPLQKIGLRMPRVGVPSIIFASNASEAATWNCQVVMGLFPVSLGQDAITGGL